jgi:hypothetical protein
VQAIATDIHYNPINTAGRVRFTSNRYAQFASAEGDLNTSANGYGEFSTTLFLKAAGSHTIEVRDVNLDGTVSRTQSTVLGLVGSYAKLQLVLPGQVTDPGSDLGKTAAPITAQKAGVPFTVTINAVDQFWNVISLNGGDTKLTGNVPAILFNPPNNEDTPGADPRTFTNGTTTREIIVGQQGLTQITAIDDANLTKPGQTVEVAVNPGPVYVFTTPASATAGQPFSVTISLEENGVPLASANNTIQLTAQLASGGASSGQFNPDGSPRTYTLTNGQVTINDLAYSYVERIKIKVNDGFNRVGFSNDLDVNASGL